MPFTCRQHSKVESRFELESAIARLGSHGAEVVEALQSQVRRANRRSKESALARRRMVEDIRGIQPDGHAFGFADSNLLLDGHIGCPAAQVLKAILTKSAARSRKWSLQHNLICSNSPDRIERAITL